MLFWDFRDILLGIHILAAIIWVGSMLFVGWGVFPSSSEIPAASRQKFFISLMRRSHLPFAGAGVVVILTGILLGTVVGPLRSWAAVFSSSYGQIWLTALLVALFTLFWGVFVGYRYTMKKLTDPVLWKTAEKGSETALKQAFLTIALTESVEGAGFLVLIGLMISF